MGGGGGVEGVGGEVVEEKGAGGGAEQEAVQAGIVPQHLPSLLQLGGGGVRILRRGGQDFAVWGSGY